MSGLLFQVNGNYAAVLRSQDAANVLMRGCDCGVIFIRVLMGLILRLGGEMIFHRSR